MINYNKPYGSESNPIIICFINGIPRSGKDEFAKILAKYSDVRNISSITPIQKLLAPVVSPGEKNDTSRELWSEVGAITERLYGYRSSRTADEVITQILTFKNMQQQKTRYIFVHVRESHVINAIKQKIEQKCNENILYLHFLVHRPDVVPNDKKFPTKSDEEAWSTVSTKLKSKMLNTSFRYPDAANAFHILVFNTRGLKEYEEIVLRIHSDVTAGKRIGSSYAYAKTDTLLSKLKRVLKLRRR